MEDRRMNGWLITLEGPEGGGKSTQIALLRDFLERAGVPCTVVREPGGTEIGDRIRGILLDPRAADMTVRTEILLYAASRAQLVERVILPALRRGEVVLCDRFVDSSMAYQGFGAFWDREEIRLVNRVATGGLRPDRTYLLDVPVEESIRRLQSRGRGVDRIERKGKEYHERVRQGFLHLASAEPDRFLVVDASRPADEVFRILRRDLEKLIPISREGEA
jgi:dTMP kinase